MPMDFYYIFRQDDLLIHLEGDTLSVPTSKDYMPEGLATFIVHEENSHRHLLVDYGETMDLPEGFYFETMRNMRDHYGKPAYAIAIKCYQLYNWRRKHRFCGSCGTSFKPMNPDRSLKCPNCGNLLFPQTSNAIIVAILKEDKLLLAHNQNFPEGLYSLIAGFVEMGESFEDAVHREIYEEVGIRVKNVRYFDNQEWPFPNSTMIGFFADYDSGDIKVDGEEILQADWFTPDDFPVLPGKASIARRIIDTYQASYSK